MLRFPLKSNVVNSQLTRGIFMKLLFSKKTRKTSDAILAASPGLEKALLQKAIQTDILTNENAIGRWFRPFLKFRKERSIEYVNSLVIYERISAQAHRPEWKGTSLPSGFASWVRLTFLYLWLVEHRFRYVQQSYKRPNMIKPMVDWLFHDIEIGISQSLNTQNPMVIIKYSKIFLTNWLGACLAYDVGSITSDTSLADAIWRNLYAGDPNTPLTEIQALVQHVREEQYRLMQIPDEVILDSAFEFTSPPFQIPADELLRIEEEKKVMSTIYKDEGGPLSAISAKNVPISDLLSKQYQSIIEREKLAKKHEQEQDINNKN